MAVGTFDTLKAAKTLTAAGFGADQAEAITGITRDAVSEGIATKADLAALENRMLRFGVGLAFAIVAAQTALTVGLLKLLGGG